MRDAVVTIVRDGQLFTRVNIDVPDVGVATVAHTATHTATGHVTTQVLVFEDDVFTTVGAQRDGAAVIGRSKTFRSLVVHSIREFLSGQRVT